MIIHNDASFSIWFGDARDSFVPADYYDLVQLNYLFEHEPFVYAQKKLKLNNIVFLKQVHSADGLVIKDIQQLANMSPFSHKGDFLVTKQSRLGLSVATADCLPIVVYDTFSHAIAIVHAGWRGSVQHIAQSALEALENNFAARRESVKFFFGPCAKVCCYQVGDELLSTLEQFSFIDDVVVQRGGSYYFNLSQFNKLLLQEIGVSKEACNMHYNLCTMCDESFCSYRRSNGASDRQMTVVVLK